MVLSDVQEACNAFDSVDLKEVAKKISGKMTSFNLSRIGNSIVYTPGGLSTPQGQLPAHTNNFLEIMADGSARMRILLINNNQNDSSVNMVYAGTVLNLFKDAYTYIMGCLFPSKMVYAKKYEALTVRRQFNPTVFYDDAILEAHPEWQADNERMLASARNYRLTMGNDTVVTDDRIPKTGLYTIDKRQMESWGVEYTAEAIIDELFLSRFVGLGAASILDKNSVDN